MDRLTFAWDPKKAQQNLKKHKVSFQEAVSVFFDESATEYFDEDHSAAEDRFLMLGISFPSGCWWSPTPSTTGQDRSA